jgi:hypothetical protein
LIAIVDHPEFVLDAPLGGPGAFILLSRPECDNRQHWAKEPRGKGFVFRSVFHGLLLSVRNGRVVLGDDRSAVVLMISRMGALWTDGSPLLLLDTEQGKLFQNVPVVMAPPTGAVTQKWCFWATHVD